MNSFILKVSGATAVYSQGICPADLLEGHHQKTFCSSWPSSPAVSPWNQTETPVTVRCDGQNERFNYTLEMFHQYSIWGNSIRTLLRCVNNITCKSSCKSSGLTSPRGSRMRG